MPNIQDTQEGFFSKMINLLKQFPLVAVCVWLGYRDLTREATIEQDKKEQVARDTDRETFYRSQLLYMRDLAQEQNKEKQAKLDKLNKEEQEDGKATIK